MNKLEAEVESRNHVILPLVFCIAMRLIVYIFANQHRHFFEGDSVRYMGYMMELMSQGTIDGGNWNAPGYFLFESLCYQVLHWGHYGLLAFQNLFDLVLAFFLMNEVKQSARACWAIALIGTCDLATVLYANSMMTESLSAVLLSAGVLLALKRRRLFWGAFMFGLSCVVRGGNWPVFVIFLAILIFKNRRPLAKNILIILAGAALTVGPVITYNGLKFNHWNLSSQGEYHAVTIGAGIIMRQKDVSWAQGEIEFNAYHDDLISKGVISANQPLPRSRMQALVRYISENKKAFVWSVARGFATQFVGGQNAEIMHRFAGREIEKEPLPALVHRLMIGVHAIWMTLVWILFISAAWYLWRRQRDRGLVLFTLAALIYFFVSVATLGSARFRIPCMPAVALCVALAFCYRDETVDVLTHEA